VPTPDWFAELLDFHLSERQINQLYAHYDLLLRWSQRMNLTTVKAGREMVIRHYCESLFFAEHLRASEDISLIDVGSGAGFPGVPMAILRPEWRVKLVESHQRKAVFLRESSRELNNVTVLAQRIEDVAITTDWLVARAVEPREVLAQVPRLAFNIGLMLGEEDFSALKTESRIAWGEPVRLPWGDRRICVYGQHVPRGT
jgi:16S rRNA (guanine527-N7)-methyltransferase